MKKAKQKCGPKVDDGYPVPRVYHRTAQGRKSARLLIKCGDCDQKFEIYYGPDGEDLEIAGVLASVKTWRAVLLPLLKKPVRRKLRYRHLGGRSSRFVWIGELLQCLGCNICRFH